MVALAVLGYASFEFAGRVTSADAPARSAAKPSSSRSAASAAVLLPQSATSAPATQSPAVLPPPRVLVPVSAAAFGPDGVADGDDPQNAARVLTDPASGWATSWYATPGFGELKPGTGLLLDMGRLVTITSVQITLGVLPGASLELRAGAAPSLAALPVVRSAADAGDLVDLPLAGPVRARYALLWFTSLPPDGAGTYQVVVHQVTVDGRT
jgi:hypothetical protein